MLEKTTKESTNLNAGSMLSVQHSPRADTIEIADLRASMTAALATSVPNQSNALSTALREIASDFRMAIEINEVKRLRNERNELPVAFPIKQTNQEVDGTPITELGLTQATLRKCQSQLVAFRDWRRNRFTSVGQGIATIEQLASIPTTELRTENYVDREIRDIEKNLARFMSNPRSELVGNQKSTSIHTILLNSTDLIGGFTSLYGHTIINSPATKAVLKEDIAFLPGISAESVVWLKRIPLLDRESGTVRNLSTVADLVQIVVAFPDNWVGFNALQVNNYLLTFGLTLGITFNKNEDEAFEINEVQPITPHEGFQDLLIEMDSVFAMHK